MRTTNFSGLLGVLGARSVVVSLCAVFLGFGCPVHAQDAEFHALGDLPGGEFESYAYAVSDEGKRVIGSSRSGDVNPTTAFVWSRQSGMVSLGDTSDGYSVYEVRRQSMSPDGRFIVGWIYNLQDASYVAFKWSSDTGFIELPTAAGFEGSSPYGVSATGAVVVGRMHDSSQGRRAFRWTQESGMNSLGLLNDGDIRSSASAVSDDGRIIVGVSSPERGGEAFRWTESDGLTGLGFLAGKVSSFAAGMSGDGGVIVGSSSHLDPVEDIFIPEAFRWTADEGMTALGGFPPDAIGSEAKATTDNGEVIVGEWRVSNPASFLGWDEFAFVWREETGPLKLSEVLMDGGAQGLEGWTLGSAEDISADGQWIVGSGTNPDGNPEAFLARLSSDVVPRSFINPGLNDAWYNPATNGQGFLITVLPDIQSMFVAWFTFDAERPMPGTPSEVGEPGHRWLTAQGPYSDNTATLTIYITKGGVFDSVSPPATTDPAGDGTMTFEFADCSNALVTYDITSAGLSGEIPLQRIANDNVALCESLSGQ